MRNLIPIIILSVIRRVARDASILSFEQLQDSSGPASFRPTAFIADGAGSWTACVGGAQACGELADARRQRAVAQRFLCAQDRGMLRPGELQTVQQAILDRVHY